MKKEPIWEDSPFEITDHDIVLVQRAWIKYRDEAARLFTKIAPSVTEQQWKDYLSEIRTKELSDIHKLRD